MSYLIASDYNKQIQADNLNQITGSDASILSSAELAAQEEVTSYLTQRYDLAQELTNIAAYDAAVVYKAGQRVTSTGLIYFAALPYPMFDYTKLYVKGDQVFWKDKTYTAAQDSIILDHSTQIQYSAITDIPQGSVFPDDPVNGRRFWGTGAAYQVAANTPLTDTKWTKADNRSQQLVSYMVDIVLFHLHSRISPRNIPDLRVKRYDDAIKWLKSAGKGDITANLPLKQVRKGGRIRFGGNPKLINRY
jgi:phage gp36-like protein